jgi:DNA-binding LacI/PurR family transcriptional regulator
MVMRDKPGPSQESIDRVRAAARELGYQPHASARLLRQSRTGLIGAVFAMSSPFQVRVVQRIASKAADAGYGIALGPMSEDRPSEDVVAQLIGERVEALFAFNIDPRTPDLQRAAKRIPTVLLGEWSDDPIAHNVHVDEDEGLRLAIAHLKSLGHRDIAYVGGAGGKIGEDRLASYERAMRSEGLDARADVIRTGFFEEDGAEAAREFLQRSARPTALVCCGDLCAVGLLATLTRSGISVPEEVSVVGFDDSYVAGLSYNRLTTVHQDVDETADATLAAILERLEVFGRPTAKVATSATLVVRDTTGPAPMS